MSQTAFLPASRQEADLGSVRTSDVLLTYSWEEVSVSLSLSLIYGLPRKRFPDPKIRGYKFPCDNRVSSSS